MSIGVASAHGKIVIHSHGTIDVDFKSALTTDHDSFLESMADADLAVMDYMHRENIVYVSVANRLSVDCDCVSNHVNLKWQTSVFCIIDPWH